MLQLKRQPYLIDTIFTFRTNGVASCVQNNKGQHSKAWTLRCSKVCIVGVLYEAVASRCSGRFLAFFAKEFCCPHF